MQYDINLANVEREQADLRYAASIVYTFTISNGAATAYARVVLTEASAGLIEQKGADPKTAARIALERLLRQGRDPFATQILLRVPFGHADYFAKHGSYGALPTLTE